MKYIERKDDDYYCRAEKIDIYIPSYYFTSNMAKELGTNIETIGIIYLEIFETAVSKPIVFFMNCPVVINLVISESSKVKKNFSKAAEEIEEYRVFTVHRNDLMIKNAVNIQYAKAADKFFNIINNGKIPETVKYEDLPDNLIKNASFNGIGLGVPYSIIEIMMSELARDAKNNFIPFRKVAGKTGQQDGYESMRINDIPNLSSTFQGLSFENVTDAVLNGVISSKNGIKQVKSPTEDILYY